MSSAIRKKLFVLLWKCIVLRKRNWILTIFELVSPISVVFLLWYINYEYFSTKYEENANFEYIKTNHSSDYSFISSNTNLFDNSPVHIKESTYIAYAPNTSITDQLMSSYKTTVDISDPSHRLRVEAKRSEEDLEAALREHLLSNSSYGYVLGVVFSDPTTAFKYKIIVGDFDDFLESSEKAYISYMLFKLQVYLNAQYLKSVGVSYEDSKIHIGELLKSDEELLQSRYDNTDELMSTVYLYLLYGLITLSYTFLVTAVIRDTIQEKSSGIKELMRIMGLSSWMIWIHWFIYSMFVQIPATVAIAVILTATPPHVFEANVLVVWILFLLVSIDYIVIFFTVSCFFDRATKATILCVLFWIIINFALFAVLSPRAHSHPVQLLISLIPLVNLCWSLQSLNSFHFKHVDWNLSYLFTEGYTGSHVSAGEGIVIMVIEIVLFTLLLAYFDAVKPGYYGVAKPVTFIFDHCINLCKKESHTPDSETSSLPSNFEPPLPGTKVGIEIRELHKEFGVFKKVVAVDSVNLDIYEGEVTVLLGHNGAGKTTTMSMITGMFSPTSGTVLVDDQNIYDNLYEFRQSLGLCTQHNLYFPKLTVLEHLVFFGMLKGMSRSMAKEEATYLLHSLNLLDKKNLRGSKLSGGMLRRLCLAVALTGGPKILILDEPTSGLDPENRRHIWDIILSLRGERTILVTTHYMEEADVLGDRIAIMDHGKVVCCGTTMFLKKLYGAGYSIHVVTKKPNKSFTDITQCVQRNIAQFGTKVVSPVQVDFSIKDEFVARFPELFLNLESAMTSLGVASISVSCTTMEDVFLRVAELSEEQNRDHVEPKTNNVLPNEYNKVEGVKLLMQRVEALVIKRALYISKHFISAIVKFIIAWLLILCAAVLTNHFSTKDNRESRYVNQKTIDFTLNPGSIYPIIYDELNAKTAKIAENMIDSVKGQVFMVNLENSSYYVEFDTIYQPMNKLLTNMALSTGPLNRLVLAFTFIGNYFLIQYKSLSNSFVSNSAANLMANILLKRVHPERSIEVISHFLTSNRKHCNENGFLRVFYTILILVTLIPCALTLVMSDFIPPILEERVTGFKYQQIIAGVSPLVFRLCSLLCDVCIYLVFIIVSLAIVLIFGGEAMSLNSESMRMLLLVLILYGVSFIIFLGVFSYISNSSPVVTGLYVLLNIVFLVGCPIAFLIFKASDLSILCIVIILSVLSLHPTAALFFSLVRIAMGIASDSVCEVGKLEPLLGVPTSSNKTSIFIYLLFLVLDIILYSILTFIIDSNICARVKYKSSEIKDCREGDDDVKFETLRVKMFKEADVDTTPLRVEGLVKKYHSFRAVNQVSFLVSRGECFGLLGVNGAGKTTTFKMLTGEITPNSGDAFSGSYSVVSETQKYLSNIGYCPQFDAILDDLTGNDTLSIIAKIRGVPRKEIRQHVDYWMTLFGIEEHANKRTKTYSGGTKRKLSTAMAFIGDPVVALLDEPTTGVDPAARRKVWSGVQNRQSLGYSSVLSSHSMEECEALCSRLTIMRRGGMCCIGSVQELKAKFGQGYVVLLKLGGAQDNQIQLEALKKECLNKLPKSVIQDENINMITFRVLDANVPLSWVFSEALRLRKKYDVVEDFIVTNATLEQLFLAVARGQDVRKSMVATAELSQISVSS